MAVGAIVRVRLHGRRVRGWVVGDHVASEVDEARLQPLVAVSSAGPPPEVVALCRSVAYRCAGPLAAVLRSASPPNNVAPGSITPRAGAEAGPLDLDLPASDTDRAADALVQSLGKGEVIVVRWPPLFDRRRLVASLLAVHGSTIVLTADGTRAAAFHRWLSARGTRTVLLHSDVSAAARTDAWRVAAGGGCVVVGGRSAAFAPVPDLECAVLLDEGDEALQEERSPTWHARDVLFERSPATYVVTPAPTAVAVRAAATVAAPLDTVESSGWPRVEVVDQRDEPPGVGLLSDPLVAAVQSTFAGSRLSVLVLNRRGGVRLLRCATCHQLTRWDAHGRVLLADEPGVSASVPPGARPRFCVHCGGTRLVERRGGVQRLAATLSARVPKADVAVVDAAVGHVPDVPVVVGTEAVLHRDEVRRRRPGLVAFVDFDAELGAPRYRAAEQALWLVVRAARVLAAGDRSESRVLIQTHDPDHVVVQAARRGAPQLVAADELDRRAAFGLPPFGALAEVRGASEALAAAADALAAIEKPGTGITVDVTDKRVMVRAQEPEVLARALERAVDAGRAHGGVRVATDPPRI